MIKHVPVCDVYKTARNVAHYTVTITLSVTGESSRQPGEDVAEADLSQRGLDRLRRFIRRGMVSAKEWTRSESIAMGKVSGSSSDPILF